MISLFFQKYWRELVIVLAFVICGLFVGDVITTKERLVDAKATIIRINTEKMALINNLAHLAELSEKQSKQLDEAAAQRALYMNDLGKKINSIRLQQVPKDCQGAVDFAVKNKNDLSWPD